ncbi:hypothetical protein TNCV_4594531 [Trichonephila clavipes]|uniref:Uncharacterized protein n=1 Tax=Trichonephila clavipes TaxID=2585209 RepID=A0A8X6WGH8_TRICX|nr:hypothetical protein TNCV_4594531 [Trichonephila clavipes]
MKWAYLYLNAEPCEKSNDVCKTRKLPNLSLKAVYVTEKLMLLSILDIRGVLVSRRETSPPIFGTVGELYLSPELHLRTAFTRTAFRTPELHLPELQNCIYPPRLYLSPELH